MAVLFALERCKGGVSVYGFGANGEGRVSFSQAGECTAPGARARCWKSTACEKYYQCFRTTLMHPDQMPPGTARQLPSYWKDMVKFHDVSQEWGWLARMHHQGALFWAGAPS